MQHPRGTRQAIAPPLAPSKDARLPLSIRLTMEEVLDTADDADLRASILESSVGCIPTSSGIARKANRLHETAADLRDIADHMGEGLTEPGRSP